jgi:2-amino-4-hydroxy-6-hydroxymethyldihydropteridine diphosphokinase
MNIAYLSIGGNIGDRADYLRRSIEHLQLIAGKIISVSSIYETEPWGVNESQWFLNCVVSLKTELSPMELLTAIQQIESNLGRVRTENVYQPRTIDIDILLYNDLIMNSDKLVIPHKSMTDRMFVLLPLSELAPELEHPTLKCSISLIKNECKDTKKIKKYEFI